VAAAQAKDIVMQHCRGRAAAEASKYLNLKLRAAKKPRENRNGQPFESNDDGQKRNKR
jgi:hypothetical protein